MVLNTVLQEDFWTPPRLGPQERMLAAAGMDRECGRDFGLDSTQRKWLVDEMSRLNADAPLLVFAHAGVAELATLLARPRGTTVVHGHTHSAMTGWADNVLFQGMLATAWPMVGESRCGYGIVEMGLHAAPVVSHHV